MVSARRPGRFLLTGSANLLLMDRVSESLAGRALHLGLWPMTAREVLGQGIGGLWSSLFETHSSEWRSLIDRREPLGSSWQENLSTVGADLSLTRSTRGKLLPVEIKASDRPSPADSRGIRLFMDLHRDQVVGGLVLHGGTECFEITGGLFAAPVDRVL
jgi:hypothetical protein